MRLGFTDDQTALRDGVRELLADRCPPAVLRSVGAGEIAEAQRLWRRLADAGLLGALVPEASGGLGLDLVDVVLCLEETGRVAAPLPVVESAVVAAALLPGADELGALAAGELRVTAALDGSGLAPWVPFCDAVLLGDGGDGGQVRLVPVASCAVRPGAAVDPARPVSVVRAPARAGTRVDADPERVAAARRAGAVATAAQLAGLADRMLRMTVDYVKGRQQFGVPVGSFQAVKHRLADGLEAVELARPMVYAAAWSHARGVATADRDAAAAKVRAGEAAGQVARAALQSHGAMGYTQEYDLHLWLTRTWALQAAWGHQQPLRDVVAEAIGL
jgi:alkylation response protein AidB-like acyl-CoA dehydrogenase